MSAPSTVYVQLLDEGTVIYRPVGAEPLRPDVVRLVAPSDYDSDVETWEFPPGAVVRVAPRHLAGGVTFVAVAIADA